MYNRSNIDLARNAFLAETASNANLTSGSSLVTSSSVAFGKLVSKTQYSFLLIISKRSSTN